MGHLGLGDHVRPRRDLQVNRCVLDRPLRLQLLVTSHEYLRLFINFFEQLEVVQLRRRLTKVHLVLLFDATIDLVADFVLLQPLVEGILT